MHEVGANGQILRLNQELMLIRSKHNELIRAVEIAEKGKATVAEANKFLLEKNKGLLSQLNKLKEEHTQLISKSKMLDSVISTIAEKRKSLVEKELSDFKQKLEQVSTKYIRIEAFEMRFYIH